MTMQDTFAFASQAICHALGVQVIYSGSAGHGTVSAVLGAGFESVESGDVRVASRRLEIQVTAADLGITATDGDTWNSGTVQFLEGPLAGEILNVAKAKPDIEGVSVTLLLKRAG